MSNKKTPFYYSSRFWVMVYAAVMFVLTTMQLILGIMQSQNLQFHLIAFDKFVNGECNLPMEAASWCWTALISLYCGFDRFVDIKTTLHMSSGQMSLGELGKLRVIILEAFILLVYSVICNFLVEKDFQLTSMMMAFGMSIIIYVSGSKLVKAYRYDSVDSDKDGIPDEYQHDYEKWVRAQKKEGVDEVYITWDYFLDAHDDIYKALEEKKE